MTRELSVLVLWRLSSARHCTSGTLGNMGAAILLKFSGAKNSRPRRSALVVIVCTIVCLCFQKGSSEGSITVEH